MIKVIEQNQTIFAKIIRAGYQSSENEFFTKEKDEIQFGVASYPKNYKTGTHFHNHIEKETTQVDEILIVREGCARVDFYNNEGIYIKSSEIFKDDTLIIFKGGHNISFNENTKLIVIKPSTYTQAYDKTRIIGVNDSDLIIEND